MSRLEQLMEELCPDGVKYKKLSDLEDENFLKLGRGNVISKIELQQTPGNYPVYSSSSVGDGEIGRYGMYMFDDERITWSIDGGGKLFYRNNIKYSVTNVGGYIKVISDKLSTKFLYYSLINSWALLKFDYTKKAHPSVIRDIYEIPLPPLPVQEEIVHILDTFTELIAELTAELTARKKQFEYYRDSLLTFGDEVEWKPLKDVALEFGRGKSKHRPRNDSRLYGGVIPFVQTGDIRNAAHTIEQFTQTYSNLGLEQSKLWPKGTLCITIAANIAETTVLGFDACFPDSIIGFVADPKKTNSSYVEYLLTSYKSKLQSKSTGSAQENINLATFENWLLPFPPLPEQQRIVDILDRFDTLCNDISSGLPAEIKARQQQYEYYRDKLLTFPKAGLEV